MKCLLVRLVSTKEKEDHSSRIIIKFFYVHFVPNIHILDLRCLQALNNSQQYQSVTKAMTLGSENYISKALAVKELAAMIADFFAKKKWENRQYH